MKAKILLFSVAVLISYSIAWAQPTSFGGFIDPNAANNAGIGGAVNNSYFGYEAGLLNTGEYNTFTGYRSGYTNGSGLHNTANGAHTLYSNTTGGFNVAVGSRALFHNDDGDSNTAVGYSALFANDHGHNNTAVGSYALTANDTGDYNTAIGGVTIPNNSTGYRNTAVGYGALNQNTTGHSNTGNGYRSLYSNSTGAYNTAIGYEALYNNTTSWNTAIGYQALVANTSGFSNTAIGYQALDATTTGDRNTAVGVYALNNNITGGNNTVIGYNAGPNAGGHNNTTTIGYDATTTANNQVRIGNALVNSIGGYAHWSNVSDGRFKKDIKEDIPGLDFIIQLRPVSYDLDRTKIRTFLGKEEEENTTSTSYRRDVGFVAQEVEQLLKENDYTPIGVESPQNEQDHYSIRYAEFVVPLTKAVQELNTLVTTQQQLIETQQQRIEALERLVAGTAKENSDGSIQAKDTDIAKESFVLYQNVPNPFNQTTTIKAVVPENVQQAKIVIYNLQGSELERYHLDKRGTISLDISGGRFPSGMYIYALIADEKTIDTKKMILTK